MNARQLVVLFGLVVAPSQAARLGENPSLSIMGFPKLPKSDSDFPALLPTDTALYEKYVCVGNPDGLRLLVPGSCSKYYECFNGVASVNSCADPTPYYDPFDQTCIAESNCVNREIEVPGGPLGCQGVCCGKDAGLYADSSDKTQFYFCNNNVGILHTCCSGEQFNPITKACDVPANCP